MRFAREGQPAAGPHFGEASVLSPSTTQRYRVAGFTMLELIIVFVVLGIMLSFMVRAVRGSWVAASRRSASRDVTAYLYRARGIAIQQSRAAWLARSGNILKIMVDSSRVRIHVPPVGTGLHDRRASGRRRDLQRRPARPGRDGVGDLDDPDQHAVPHDRGERGGIALRADPGHDLRGARGWLDQDPGNYGVVDARPAGPCR